MSRNSLVVLLAVVAMVMIAGQAEASTISGSLETCPGGDPIVDAPIRIYVGTTWCHTAYTNSNGGFIVDTTFWGLIYGQSVSVSLGPAVFPYKGGSCPIQRTTLYTGGSIIFPAIKFACGTAKTPPCPTTD